MKKVIYLVSLLIIAVLFLNCSGKELKVFNSEKELVADAKARVEMISPEEFKKLLDSKAKYYLIDCREESEYDTSCIPGAINIPRGLLEFQIGNKVDDRRADVILYCSDGQRSVLAASVLPCLKFSNVRVISDGFDSWKQKYPELIQLKPGGTEVKSDAPPTSSGGCGG
jgi:rhodanese-related sulfurtransferase